MGVEQRFRRIGERGFIAGFADPVIVSRDSSRGAVADCVGQQEQTWALASAVTKRVGGEHRGEALAVVDAGENRQHVAVAIKRVDLNLLPFTIEPKHATPAVDADTARRSSRTPNSTILPG